MTLRIYPENEHNGANQSPGDVLWELFQREFGQAQIGVPLPQEHLILTHELQNVWDCCASISQNCWWVFFLFLFFLTMTIKMTSTSKRNQLNKKSAWRCYSICLLFSNKKNKFVTKVVWNKRKEEFVLCEDFSGNPSCLSLHRFDCFCTVYT